MFTKQSNQIANALRMTGSQSAKEMVQAIANCAQPLEHRGVMALTLNSPVHPNTFIPPRGVTLSQSVSRAQTAVPTPGRDAPLWQAIPGAPEPTAAKQNTMRVRGPSKIDDLQAGNVQAVDVAVRGMAVGRALDVDGDGRFRGRVVVERDVRVEGGMRVEGRAEYIGNVTHNGPVTHNSPVYNTSETHNYGPTYQYGPTQLGGKTVKPFLCEVVVDVLWTGTVFQKVTRQILAVSQPGPTSTATVFECS
jgi:hypothetical protein